MPHVLCALSWPTVSSTSLPGVTGGKTSSSRTRIGRTGWSWLARHARFNRRCHKTTRPEGSDQWARSCVPTFLDCPFDMVRERCGSACPLTLKIRHALTVDGSRIPRIVGEQRGTSPLKAVNIARRGRWHAYCTPLGATSSRCPFWDRRPYPGGCWPPLRMGCWSVAVDMHITCH